VERKFPDALELLEGFAGGHDVSLIPLAPLHERLSRKADSPASAIKTKARAEFEKEREIRKKLPAKRPETLPDTRSTAGSCGRAVKRGKSDRRRQGAQLSCY